MQIVLLHYIEIILFRKEYLSSSVHNRFRLKKKIGVGPKKKSLSFYLFSFCIEFYLESLPPLHHISYAIKVYKNCIYLHKNDCQLPHEI